MAPKIPKADATQATITRYVLAIFVFFSKSGASIAGPSPKRDTIYIVFKYRQIR